jgi:hypothetical protein
MIKREHVSERERVQRTIFWSDRPSFLDAFSDWKFGGKKALENEGKRQNCNNRKKEN